MDIPLGTRSYPGDLADGIKAGRMLHAEASGPRFQASSQAIHADFHDPSFAPVFGADVRSSLLTAEMLAGPRTGEGRLRSCRWQGALHLHYRCAGANRI